MKELQEIILATQADSLDPSIIVATVVQTGESTYCRPGARILLTETDQTIGAIYEDYIDKGVVTHVKKMVRWEGCPQVHQYCPRDRTAITRDYPQDLRKTTIILFEQLSSQSARAQFDFIAECYQENQSGAIATIFTVEGAVKAQIASRLFLKMDGSVTNLIGDHLLTNLIFQDTVKTLATGQTRITSYPFIDGFVKALIEVVAPPTQLLIFGITPYTTPITLFAKQLGWTVVIVDHPPATENLEHFPEADEIILSEVSDLPKKIQLTPHTAAVVMTGNFETDLELLKLLVPSSTGYLGLLSSKSRTQRLIDLMQRDGLELTPDQLRRLHGPVGLDIGAETPHEIALAIVSEIQAVLKHRTGSFIREQQNSIHTTVSEYIHFL